MTYSAEGRAVLQKLYQNIDNDDEDIRVVMEDMKNVSSAAHAFSPANDFSMRISALLASNNHDLTIIRTRNKEIKQALESWWKAL